ncbi:MAG: FkbM family methyltransferase [Synechococcaceae cyanobacterium]|nr:FkbM family methyltransferase [Synechococcaceae cyanobacterium]
MPRKDEILSEVSKVLHVGANKGQEAEYYARMGVRAWHVEAIPDLYQQLCERVKGLEGQTALLACLSAHVGDRVSFNVANNGGESSSLLPLGGHRNCYPMVAYTHAIEVETSTVDELIRQKEIDADIDLLVIDAQGAELMILEGSRAFLASGKLRYLLVEVSVEPLYEGGVSYLEVAAFLRPFGLYLRELVFNDKGWTDALFEPVYWPTTLPYSSEYGGVNVAPTATLSFSSEFIVPAPAHFSGERTGRFSFHTSLEPSPWVKMTFPRPYDSASIVVFNRCDDCRERAYPLNVYASADGVAWNLLIENNEPFGGVDWPGPLRMDAPETFTSLLFKLRGTDYLHFDQIEVYVKPESA